MSVTDTISNSNIGYYRSRIISTSAGSNQLITAAAPLFLLAEKLHQTNFSANRNKLIQDLTHEIKAFENKATITGFSLNNIAAARTALCGLLDTIITNTTWGKENNWNTNTLTANLEQTETNKDFFNLLEQSLKDAKDNLELLELFYLVLSFGYEGEYALKDNKHQLLNALTDKLYSTIRQLRASSDKLLLVTANTSTAIRVKPNWKKIILITLGIIILINFGAYITYRVKLSSLLHPITTMIKQHNDSIRNLGGPTS